jgi:hypothetical protein
MKTPTVDKDTPILIEFAPQPGVRGISRMSAADLAKKSAEAVEAAMGTIKSMARRVSALHDEMPHEFTRIEIDFGVKLDAEAGALLAKAGGEASLNVTLTWERPDKAAKGK